MILVLTILVLSIISLLLTIRFFWINDGSNISVLRTAVCLVLTVIFALSLSISQNLMDEINLSEYKEVIQKIEENNLQNWFVQSKIFDDKWISRSEFREINNKINEIRDNEIKTNLSNIKKSLNNLE